MGTSKNIGASNSATSCFFTTITLLSVPCPVSLATLRTCCVVSNGQIVVNKTGSLFSGCVLLGYLGHAVWWSFPLFPDTALILNQSSLACKTLKAI